MVILKKEANIFDSDADVLVNSVNVKGIMGAGIAREFAKRFPDMFKDYRRACKKGEIAVEGIFNLEISGKEKKLSVKQIWAWRPHIWISPGQKFLILNFPSKIYWDTTSDYKIIEEGLKWILGNIENLSSMLGRRIKKIAMPQIGAGFGKLDSGKVISLVKKYFDSSDIIVEVFIYERKNSLVRRYARNKS